MIVVMKLVFVIYGNPVATTLGAWCVRLLLKRCVTPLAVTEQLEPLVPPQELLVPPQGLSRAQLLLTAHLSLVKLVQMIAASKSVCAATFLHVALQTGVTFVLDSPLIIATLVLAMIPQVPLPQQPLLLPVPQPQPLQELQLVGWHALVPLMDLLLLAQPARMIVAIKRVFVTSGLIAVTPQIQTRGMKFVLGLQ
jgi:hypothetical protein